jgi:hypothetical protein
VAKWNFLTVPDELLGQAVAIATHCEALGYHVIPEPRELGYPFSPTLRCTRSPTTLLVEVARRAQVDRLSEWAAYASACEADTRIALGLPAGASVPQKQSLLLSKLGIGLLVVSANGVTETLAPRDLSMNVNLPRISRDAASIRSALGAVYEHFGRSNWREGFGDACVVFEDACRKYLWKAISSGRTSVLKQNGQPKALTRSLVDGMTMGQLAADCRRMQKQNHCDNVVADTLTALNPDRILVAHKMRRPKTEARLRKSVGPQMWRIVTALREIYKATGTV